MRGIVGFLDGGDGDVLVRLPESVDVGGDDELGGVGAEDGVVRVRREQSADREGGAGRKRGADRVRDVGE